MGERYGQLSLEERCKIVIPSEARDLSPSWKRRRRETSLAPYCAAIFEAAGAKSRSISRRSFTAVSDSSITTSA